jgi:hypothetical protein
LTVDSDDPAFKPAATATAAIAASASCSLCVSTTLLTGAALEDAAAKVPAAVFPDGAVNELGVSIIVDDTASAAGFDFLLPAGLPRLPIQCEI